MKITRLEPEGLVLIEPQVFGDARGFFMESWNRRRFDDAGLPSTFVQDNFSFSRQGTLRGLHFQKPNPQGKLVMVLQGEVYDVALDLRRGSRFFGRWHSVRLSAENKWQFYVPPGFAHGFQVLSETALFHYKCTDFYSPPHEKAVRWDDSELAIPWPLPSPLLSPKDSKAPLLREVGPDDLYD